MTIQDRTWPSIYTALHIAFDVNLHESDLANILFDVYKWLGAEVHPQELYKYKPECYNHRSALGMSKV